MTDPKEDPRFRAWRVALFAAILAGFGLLGGLIVVAEAAEAQFKALGMLALPAITELCLDIARLLRTPVVALVAAAAGVGALVATFRGILDSRAKRLTIILAALNLGGLCFFALALLFPLTKITRSI